MELVINDKKQSDVGATHYSSPMNAKLNTDEAAKPDKFLFSPGDSNMTTMAHTGVNTSFI